MAGVQIGTDSYHTLRNIKKEKQNYRSQLKRDDMLLSDKNLRPLERDITMAAVDGTHKPIRLLWKDITVQAAIIVGNEEDAELGYDCFIGTQKHAVGNTAISSALMLAMQLKLAASAKHNVVQWDGSFASVLIELNQTFASLSPDSSSSNSWKRKKNKAKIIHGTVTTEFIKRADQALLDFYKMLNSNPETRVYASVPKYTTRSELGEKYSWNEEMEDRMLMTRLLEKGEYTRPVPLKTDDKEPSHRDDWHLKLMPESAIPPEYRVFKNQEERKHIRDEIEKLCSDLHIFYYRPSALAPALRVELPGHVAKNKEQMNIVMNILKKQYFDDISLMEPYYLRVADMLAKRVSRTIEAVRQIAVTTMNELRQNDGDDGDFEDIYFGMGSFRTED